MLVGIVVLKVDKSLDVLLAIVVSQRMWIKGVYLEMMHAVIIYSVQIENTIPIQSSISRSVLMSILKQYISVFSKILT